MTAIETYALEKSYSVGFWRKKTRVALRHLSLSVSEGEIFGYLGPNGAGKTTTLRLLMGLNAPTSGSFKILGGDIRDRSIRARVGFLPEQPYFYDYLTAKELLNYYGQLSGIPAADRKRRVEAVLSDVGLSDALNVQLRKFSKGMLQRVGIAQAILHDPPLVILDEPMSGLDPIGRREVRELIQALKDRGKTVFFSTHILSDAEALCDRVAVLNKGELRGIGAVADLASRTTGMVEVVWHGHASVGDVKKLGGDIRVAGEAVRAVLPQDRLDAALDFIRRSHEQIVSVTPVQSTLEDYFLAQLSKPVTQDVER
jgi:ABC-2 type transport system ATP-binding protein